MGSLAYTSSVMPRKSVGGASAPGTPASKASASRKSLNGGHVSGAEGQPSRLDADVEKPSGTSSTSSGLIVPPSAKLVLRQQEAALKTLSVGIDQFELPRTNVIKTAKSDIPDSVQLRKEVQSALIKSASVFISYLTATAHENATKKGGKIINAQHVLEAVKELDLGNQTQVMSELKQHLAAYRSNVQDKKKAATTGGKKDGAKGTAGTEEGDDAENDADISKFEGEDEADQSTQLQADQEQDETGDQSLLRKSLQNTIAHHSDEEDDDEGADQLMDED